MPEIKDKSGQHQRDEAVLISLGKFNTKNKCIFFHSVVGVVDSNLKYIMFGSGFQNLPQFGSVSGSEPLKTITLLPVTLDKMLPVQAE